MHNAILSLHLEESGSHLARFASGTDQSVRIVGSFQGEETNPAWIAKTSRSATGMQRLRNEGRNLEKLDSFADHCGIPRLKTLVDAPQEVCLIQTGVPGVISAEEATHGVPSKLTRALDWLLDFQSRAPREGKSTAELLEPLAAQISDRYPAFATWIRERSSAISIPWVTSHGDFWRGNVLYAGDHVYVIDWDEMRAGVALEDVLTLVLSYSGLRHNASVMEVFEQLFFAPNQLSELVASTANRLNLSSEQRHLSFYVFVARRAVWKEFPQSWRALIDRLADAKFPHPLFAKPL